MRVGMLLILVTGLAFCGCEQPREREVLYQVSTINALLNGVLDGAETYAEVQRHGDFGIGTFEGLDGEMAAVDGRFFQIRADGKAYPAGAGMTTPFAAVTYFDADITAAIDNPMDLAALAKRIDSLLPSPNMPYAVRIDGRFRYVKTRSVPKQARPYPKAEEIVKNQPTFEFHDVQGTLVGFRLPEYLRGVGVPGYHLHFLTADRSAGGHLLAAEVVHAKVSIDITPEVDIALPTSPAFYRVDLSSGQNAAMKKALQAVEK